MSDATENRTLTGKLYVNIEVDISPAGASSPNQFLFIPGVTYHSETDGITRSIAAGAMYAAMIALAEELRLIRDDEGHWEEVSVTYDEVKERGN